jgi:uncharacterized membrane protein YfcA
VFDLLVALAAAVAGSIAAVAGFGIGSLLTPLLALRFGTKLAVAVVSVPHFVGTAVRFSTLWRHVDRRVLIRFGVLSAAGGLAGALLNARVSSPALTIVFGLLLLFAGGSTLFGLTQKMHFGRKTAWLAGAVSGLFGGLVGNQGGIRSAALLGFDIEKESFVATATAIGLVVDGARMPVYVATQAHGMWQARTEIAVAIAGVVIGTVLGVRVLRRIPELWFRRAVAVLILLLGAYMLWSAAAMPPLVHRTR